MIVKKTKQTNLVTKVQVSKPKLFCRRLRWMTQHNQNKPLASSDRLWANLLANNQLATTPEQKVYLECDFLLDIYIYILYSITSTNFSVLEAEFRFSQSPNLRMHKAGCTILGPITGDMSDVFPRYPMPRFCILCSHFNGHCRLNSLSAVCGLVTDECFTEFF